MPLQGIKNASRTLVLGPPTASIAGGLPRHGRPETLRTMEQLEQFERPPTRIREATGSRDRRATSPTSRSSTEPMSAKRPLRASISRADMWRGSIAPLTRCRSIGPLASSRPIPHPTAAMEFSKSLPSVCSVGIAVSGRYTPTVSLRCRTVNVLCRSDRREEGVELNLFSAASPLLRALCHKLCQQQWSIPAMIGCISGPHGEPINDIL